MPKIARVRTERDALRAQPYSAVTLAIIKEKKKIKPKKVFEPVSITKSDPVKIAEILKKNFVEEDSTLSRGQRKRRARSAHVKKRILLEEAIIAPPDEPRVKPTPQVRRTSRKTEKKKAQAEALGIFSIAGLDETWNLVESKLKENAVIQHSKPHGEV